LTNEDLEKEGVFDAKKIFEKTGIKSRHISAEGETSSDLAYQAVEKLITKNNIDRNSVDYLIFCTQSPDFILPTSSCIIQNRLNLSTKTACFDFNLGCSGYVYGLFLSKALIESKQARRVLFLTGETYTKSIYAKDKSNRTIFGDAGSATMIEFEESEKEYMHSFVLGTDGSGYQNLIIPHGGFRHPIDSTSDEEKTDIDGNVRTNRSLFMNGSEIFSFTISAVPKIYNECLEKAKLNQSDIDFYLFHQANAFMINYLVKKMKIPQEKVLMNMENIGNTVSNTLPILLKDYLEKGVIKEGMKLMLLGFGVGYSYGANIIEV
jgi:3-oxoacyl-[acyl-carrier-protein] synthase-3